MPAGIRLGMSSTDPKSWLTGPASSLASQLLQVTRFRQNERGQMWERACSRRGQPKHRKIQN
jgi:hypothetical protein